MISSAIYGPALQAELAGQLMIDVHVTGQVKLSREHNSRQLYLFYETKPAFLDLKWTEAIDLYRELEAKGKIPRNKEFDNQFSTLVQVYSQRGSDARQLMLERLRTRLLEQIDQSLSEGTTFNAFAQDFDQFTTGLGMSPENPAYLENVFRTNVMTAYGSGRQRAIEDTMDVRPWWQYRTVGDSRVRDSHRLLDGLIFVVGNPKTDGLFAPNGFQCRCAAVSIDPADMPEGFKPETAPPSGYVPDPGFSKAPTKAITERIV